MAKIHQLKKVQKASAGKANITQRVHIPILPRLISWVKIKIARHGSYSYDESWNAAYKIFTALRSIAKGVKRLEILVVSSTFKPASTEVDAVVMDYATWLSMKLYSEKVRGIHSYSFSFELLDTHSIGAVIRGEHAEISDTADSHVELRKNDDNSKPRRNTNMKIESLDEYFFVYIRDIGLYGMVRAQHQEYSQKKDTYDSKSQIA